MLVKVLNKDTNEKLVQVSIRKDASLKTICTIVNEVLRGRCYEGNLKPSTLLYYKTEDDKVVVIDY